MSQNQGNQSGARNAQDQHAAGNQTQDAQGGKSSNISDSQQRTSAVSHSQKDGGKASHSGGGNVGTRPGSNTRGSSEQPKHKSK